MHVLQALDSLQQWNADGLDRAKKHILRAQTELGKVMQSAHLGNVPPVAFHPQVNRRLLGPLPPRPLQVSCSATAKSARRAPFLAVNHSCNDKSTNGSSKATEIATSLSVLLIYQSRLNV